MFSLQLLGCFLSYCLFNCFLDFHLQLFRKIMFSHIFCYPVFKDRPESFIAFKTEQESCSFLYFLLRKEVIHPHVPVGIPCYDLTPVINPTFDGFLLAVGPPASGIVNSHGLTGGVYKARERIHRSMLICDY